MEDVTDLVTIESEAKYNHKIKVNTVEAPVNVGDKVGVLELYKDGKKIKTFDITVKESIKRANVWDLYKKNFKYIVTGNV